MNKIGKKTLKFMSKVALTNAKKEVNSACVLLDISRKCQKT